MQHHSEPKLSATPHGPFDDLFDESPVLDSPSILEASSVRESVWVSPRLSWFRATPHKWPDDIGFSGFPANNGPYRRLDLFWLAWLNSRISGLPLSTRPEALDRLREIVNEAINGGDLPESLNDPEQWPRVVTPGYQPPILQISKDFVDI